MTVKDQLTTLSSYLLRPGKRKFIKTAYSLKNKYGLEIAGPSTIFGLRGAFPVYLFCASVDDVNYEDGKIWEKKDRGSDYAFYRDKKGKRIVADGDDLVSINDNTYDFVLSSHSLEHMANPLKALKEWRRVLKPQGTLVLILPDKRFTFDAKRPYTSFEHLLEDYRQNRQENDETHLGEILETFPDNNINPTKEAYASILKDNFKYRCAHHHVFNENLLKEALVFAGFDIGYQTTYPPFHLITVASAKK